MKILIKENSAFGGYVGHLADENNCIVELPVPFLVGATRFTNRNKDTIIQMCKNEAKIIFNINNIEIEDTTI